MKLFLLVCLLICLSSVSAKDKKNQDLYTKYKHLFTNKATTQGTPTFASVGNDPINCNFDTIQAAINSGVDEVRIQRFLTYTENLIIQNQSIKLIGGYDNCFEANSGAGQTGLSATIDGNNLAPVININNDNAVYDITIENLWLENGNSTINFFGGGIEAKGMLTSVNINNIRATNNAGSGINVEDIDSLIIKDSLINNNNATIGGGIACSATSTTIYGTTVIVSNSASIAGGGIYAYNQCDLTYFSGQPHPANAIAGISGNSTSGQGGGIYAYDGSTINLYGFEIDFGNGNILGDSSVPVKITNNIADSDGGGLFILGANTQATLSGIDFGNNRTSTGNGGGIAVFDQAKLVVTRYELPCWDDIHCNLFYFNRSSTGATGGGGIYAGTNTVIGIGNAYFEKNTASFGTALYLTNGSQTTIEGSVFTDNNANNGRAGNYVIDLESFSQLTLGFNTFVDNLATTTIINVNSSTMINKGNLFFEYASDPVIIRTASTLTNDCIVSRVTTDIVGTNIVQATFDPFVDRSIQNFHLDEISGGVAIDLCDTSLYNPSLKDMDHEPRGIDLPLTNTDGPYDVGADEFFVEELFSNGFE